MTSTSSNLVSLRLPISHQQPASLFVRSAYQPPANSTFLSEQTSHQRSVGGTFLSKQISTSHQPNEQAADAEPH
jgi:hypothetical protein